MLTEILTQDGNIVKGEYSSKKIIDQFWVDVGKSYKYVLLIHSQNKLGYIHMLMVKYVNIS